VERIALPTLAARLEGGGGAFATELIERASRAAFAALARIHDAVDARGPLEVRHGDLSPANLAVDETGARVVILDFDLASFRDSPARDGAFRGTIAYAAPEIARGERPSVRSDLFSLAATLLHCITGAPPRSGPSFAALIALAGETPVLAAEHASLVARGPGHAAVLACLAHEPSDRPESAHAVLAKWPRAEAAAPR
jgi:serine/threonine protein kinase